MVSIDIKYMAIQLDHLKLEMLHWTVPTHKHINTPLWLNDATIPAIVVPVTKMALNRIKNILPEEEMSLIAFTHSNYAPLPLQPGLFQHVEFLRQT